MKDRINYYNIVTRRTKTMRRIVDWDRGIPSNTPKICASPNATGGFIYVAGVILYWGSSLQLVFLCFNYIVFSSCS